VSLCAGPRGILGECGCLAKHELRYIKFGRGVESGLDETVTARYRTRFILDEGRKHMSDRLYEEGGFHIPIPLV
jgi:hypothetical protein